MKRILFLTIMITVSLQGFAQEELNNKFTPIPPKDANAKKEVVPPKEVAPPKNDPPTIVEKPDPLKINPEELFRDTNLYKPEANVEGIYYRRNQYLGGFRTKAITSTIRYRDAAFVDGDKIRILLNDEVVEAEVSLVGEFKDFKIKLKPGINKIDFEALNEGSASPNTAEFQVFDDKGTVIESSQWNVGTGYKAAIILFKE
ncbi:hypothetical protein [Flavobacterium hercynium]|uniref:Secreted protein n=1 Tax=Flavobacterium hercynium TaxID=387094 RepID=A0A226GZQ4_9FLAO|nr:hypothetical protein [Flavobacterium hercynium]OXA86911.1 hypothetical protein B0A66_17235 [Flavobacterium hercynium]SMP37141.1 hypothetical protein SAMN06265346_12723 [Flavobacterium hercynium]